MVTKQRIFPYFDTNGKSSLCFLNIAQRLQIFNKCLYPAQCSNPHRNKNFLILLCTYQMNYFFWYVNNLILRSLIILRM